MESTDNKADCSNFKQCSRTYNKDKEHQTVDKKLTTQHTFKVNLGILRKLSGSINLQSSATQQEVTLQYLNLLTDQVLPPTVGSPHLSTQPNTSVRYLLGQVKLNIRFPFQGFQNSTRKGNHFS